MEYVGILLFFIAIYYMARLWYKLGRKGKNIEYVILLLALMTWLLQEKTLYSGVLLLVLYIWVLGARILLYLKPKFDYLLYMLFDKKKGYLFKESELAEFEKENLVVRYYTLEILILFFFFCTLW